MIEKAERALDDAYNVSRRGELTNHRECIRAVLQAIREPDEAMIEQCAEFSFASASNKECAAFWQAMIDVILEDK